MSCLFTGPITNEILRLVSYFIDFSGGLTSDFHVETIAAQLQEICDHGLLESIKENSYTIHVSLKEVVRQRNTSLNLRLLLQISGEYDNVFIIGAKSSSFSKHILLLV